MFDKMTHIPFVGEALENLLRTINKYEECPRRNIDSITVSIYQPSTFGLCL